MSNTLIEKHFGRPVEYTDERIRTIADGLIEFMGKPDSYFLEEYATELGISAQRFSELADKDSYFSEALKRAKQMQMTKIAKGGLKSKLNAQMAKFTLTNVSGWREQGTMDVTSNGNTLGYVALPPTVDIEDAEILD